MSPRVGSATEIIARKSGAWAIVAHDDRGQVTLRLEVPIDDSARNVNRFVVGLELRGR